jgi:protoheme IX farnesyltransferase
MHFRVSASCNPYLRGDIRSVRIRANVTLSPSPRVQLSVRALSASSTVPIAESSRRNSRFSQFFYANTSSGIISLPREAVEEQADPALAESAPQTAPRSRIPELPMPSKVVEYPPLPDVAYKPITTLSPRRLLKIYSQLSKTRLTTLIVLTAMSGVAISPLPTTISVLLATALGTALCSASANTINQIAEVPYDAQMSRTRNRPLVRRAITPLHAAGFAVVTGLAGPGILLAFVNPTTAILGAFNIFLYAGVYTALKRRSVINTWAGSVVGGIPPLMGWTACGGQLLPSVSSPMTLFLPPFLSAASSLPPLPLPLEYINNPLSALALFSLLFTWQFPHFNSLSHLTRAGYAQAGYRMLSVTSPSKNALVSLRHSTLLIACCSILTPLAGITTWTFALTSLIPNGILWRSAWKFWRDGTEKNARVLWYNSLWYLPAVLGLMMFHKRGMEWSEWFGSWIPDHGRVEKEASLGGDHES